MAEIDYSGGDAERIRNQYRASLGRDASNDEVGGWLGGSFGGGGLDDWIRQIEGSGEAQARQQPRTLGPAPDENRPMPAETPPPAWTPPAPVGPSSAEQQILDAYQQFLGRAAAPGDAAKWLSGDYGWGSGNAGLPAILQGIQNSSEARARRPLGTPTPTPTPTPGPYQDLDWWANQGIGYGQIFDTTTGQIKPGWTRTGKGYEKAGGPEVTTGGLPPGGFQAWFAGLTKGTPSSAAALAAMEGELAKYGIKLQKDSAGTVRGRLYLPDGRAVDVVSQWGQPWTWIDRGMSTGGTGTGTGPPTPPPSPIAPTFSDEWTRLLEQLLGGRIGQLSQPAYDPMRQQYMDAMAARTRALGEAEPQYAKLLAMLEGRVNDLKGPGYTGAEGEVIRTGALDPIEQDRGAAKKRVMERLSARGLTLESGVAQQALLEVDKAFDAMRGSAQTALTTNDLNRREDRQQRADTLQGQLVDIPQMRSREQLDTFGAMQALEAMIQQENDARSREAIGYAGAGADLGPQRLRLAMEAAGMGGSSPDSIFQNLMGLAGLNQNNAAYLNSQGSSLWSGLGSIAAILARGGK